MEYIDRILMDFPGKQKKKLKKEEEKRKTKRIHLST